MNAQGMIPVECPDAQAKYDGKTVRVHIEHRGVKFPVSGKFHVKLAPTRISIEVYAGFDGTAYHFEYFHLPQAAVDTIRPTAEKVVQYEVEAVISHILQVK
jgi:hypothetical protein